jgi:hypothetical protein
MSVEIDKKHYGETSEFAKLWGVSPKTVAKYCNDKKIDGAKKIKGKWCIPLNTTKPISESEIRRILILTLKLKNNPTVKIDFTKFEIKQKDIVNVYKHLEKLNYILTVENIPTKRLPFDVTISEKGFDLIENANIKEEKESGNNAKYIADWVKTIISLIPSIISLLD